MRVEFMSAFPFGRRGCVAKVYGLKYVYTTRRVEFNALNERVNDDDDY